MNTRSFFVNKEMPDAARGLSTLKLKGGSTFQETPSTSILPPPSGITRRSNSPSRNATSSSEARTDKERQ